MRLLSVFGTRPEAIKLAPVFQALQREPQVESLVCVTAQHRELLDGVLSLFGVEPDFDLDLMEPAQSLNSLLTRAVARLDKVLDQVRPDRLVVQGDTTTALGAALAAFHRSIPVAHVEAGLRTYAPNSPWPEELNRRTIALAADLHFAPTAAARDNLCAERLHGEVFVTGNSGIDSLHHIVRRLGSDASLRQAVDGSLPMLDRAKKMILVTAHRRESAGEPFLAICGALRQLAERADIEIVYPLHPNPILQRPASEALAGCANVHLVPALDFAAFIRMMQLADLILTDSGGVQEEAVALGKPVLVLRDVTERSEAIAAGAARLLGRQARAIADQVSEALVGSVRFETSPTLFGDGEASRRIVDGLLGREVDEFAAPPSVTVAA